MTALEEALAALLMSGAYMDEEDARDLAQNMIFMLEEGSYALPVPHEFTTKSGETMKTLRAGEDDLPFQAYWWRPGTDTPTVESIKADRAEMEERLTAITGLTTEQRHQAAMAVVLGQMIEGEPS